MRAWVLWEAGEDQEDVTVLPLKADGAHQARVDAGLGKPCFSKELHLLWTGLGSLDEKEEELASQPACLRGLLRIRG